MKGKILFCGWYVPFTVALYRHCDRTLLTLIFVPVTQLIGRIGRDEQEGYRTNAFNFVQQKKMPPSHRAALFSMALSIA